MKAGKISQELGLGHLSMNVRREGKYPLLSQAQEEKIGQSLYRSEGVRTNGGERCKVKGQGPRGQNPHTRAAEGMVKPRIRRKRGCCGRRKNRRKGKEGYRVQERDSDFRAVAGSWERGTEEEREYSRTHLKE